ncbi:hypothetical protein HC891_27780, partial [Candidatus Gracilibacteria bacterium]|nr:hypothetical protein [Candidatus Gracilibacteria bacterium]
MEPRPRSEPEIPYNHLELFLQREFGLRDIRSYPQEGIATDPSGDVVPIIIGGVVVLTAAEVALLLATGAVTMATVGLCIQLGQCDDLVNAIEDTDVFPPTTGARRDRRCCRRSSSRHRTR